MTYTIGARWRDAEHREPVANDAVEAQDIIMEYYETKPEDSTFPTGPFDSYTDEGVVEVACRSLKYGNVCVYTIAMDRAGRTDKEIQDDVMLNILKPLYERRREMGHEV